MRRSVQIADLTKSNHKRKVAEIIVPVKQLHFHGPYIRQNWPFRDSLINYTTKTPSNSKAWQKLIKSCKYFFAKNPILVTEDLWWDEEKERLLNDVIFYEDFSFLSSNFEQIIFHNNIVKNTDGSIVPFEKIFAVLPKIKTVYFYDKIDSSCITKNTVKELLQIPHFSKIDIFELFNTTEKFDIEAFFKYSKKNKHTKFTIHFGNSISETYKNRLNAIIDEITETEEHDYKIPNIYFVGRSKEKWDKLRFIQR